MDINGKPDHIEDYLGTINIGYGGWFGWSDSKNKVYANLILHPKIFDCSKQELVDTHITSFPTEQECIDGLATLQSNFDTAKTNATNKKASGKQKLKDLGLDDDEIKALTGA